MDNVAVRQRERARDGRRTWLKPLSVTASIAALKWTRPAYADQLAEQYPGEVDYRNHPAEDYARASVTFENGDGDLVIAEATTSWSFVGAGLRLSFELLGPEYSMMVNTLDTPARIFLSRALQGDEGGDLVEKQNAEQGLMPLIEDEALTYGYTDENRHMVRAFLAGQTRFLRSHGDPALGGAGRHRVSPSPRRSRDGRGGASPCFSAPTEIPRRAGRGVTVSPSPRRSRARRGGCVLLRLHGDPALGGAGRHRVSPSPRRSRARRGGVSPSFSVPTEIPRRAGRGVTVFLRPHGDPALGGARRL